MKPPGTGCPSNVTSPDTSNRAGPSADPPHPLITPVNSMQSSQFPDGYIQRTSQCTSQVCFDECSDDAVCGLYTKVIHWTWRRHIQMQVDAAMHAMLTRDAMRFDDVAEPSGENDAEIDYDNEHRDAEHEHASRAEATPVSRPLVAGPAVLYLLINAARRFDGCMLF